VKRAGTMNVDLRFIPWVKDANRADLDFNRSCSSEVNYTAMDDSFQEKIVEDVIKTMSRVSFINVFLTFLFTLIAYFCLNLAQNEQTSSRWHPRIELGKPFNDNK
jgi:hypothetical protein